MREIKNINVKQIGDDEDQRIVYQTSLTHGITGEQETVEIEVRGFNDMSAAVRAVVDFAQGLLKLHLEGGTTRETESPLDKELQKLLGTD